MRIAEENFISEQVSCPCQLLNYTTTDDANATTYCTVPSSLAQVSWYIDNICPYSEIRGYVLVDQKGHNDGFQMNDSCNVNDNYVDGVSITYNSSSQRQHLYTYIVGREQSALPQSCECHGASPNYPLFLLWDFMCDSGFDPNADNSSLLSVAPRTLFTGKECAVDSSGCCQVIGAPWFYRSLPVEVNSSLEVRILSDGGHDDEMILLREVALYVR